MRVYVSSYVQECSFNKTDGGTALHVAYAGNLRVFCAACCSRWFFTFNNEECPEPAAIDGVVYTSVANNIHRHGQIEGYCENIPSGEIRIGFNVGRCIGYPSAALTFTGWNSVSRIMITEIATPPAEL